MIEANKKILETYNNYTFIRREDDSIIDIDESMIHTGDFIGISRLDGVEPLIIIGTGSHGYSLFVLGLIMNFMLLKVKMDGIGHIMVFKRINSKIGLN